MAENFFVEQARNRRISALFAAFTAAAIILTAIPLGTIAAPIIYLAILPLGMIMTAIQPHSAWAFVLHVGIAIIPMLFFAVLLGLALFLWIWRVVRHVLRLAGPDAILARLGVRAPNPQDIEERQLVDVVEEIAVAAGLEVPRVAIIDAAPAAGDAVGAANAAAVGWTIDNATVVVTRPLLDQLTREQTQAVIARVIASIGNGDLRIASLMLALFQSVRVVQFAMFGVSRRRTLRVLWHCVRSPTKDTAIELLAVGDFRATRADFQAQRSTLGCLIAFFFWPLLLPLWFSGWTIGVIISASEYLLTGPLVDATWRRRELLADATTVRLTRDPDGLAGALARLRDVPVMVQSGEVVSYLFAVWWSDQPPATLFARKLHATADRRLAQLVELGAHAQAPGKSASQPLQVEAATALAGLALGQIVWAMMAIALGLMTAELYALGTVGTWLAARLAHLT